MMNRQHNRKTAIEAMILMLCCFICLMSCDKPEKGPDAVQNSKNEASDQGIHTTFERGPVTIYIDVDKKEITLAERLKFAISVEGDENYAFELPRFGDKLEQFGIVDYTTTQPRLVEKNRTRISRSYVLEPFLSGDYKIPPMTVVFREKGNNDSPYHEIETEEIVIKVTSLLPQDQKDLVIHDIKPPVDLSMSRMVWIWAGVVAAVLIIILPAAFFIAKYLWNKNNNVQAERPAHEHAYRALEALVREDLIGKGQIKLFYQRISRILRQYIELRFGLHAPEQTTEEFLAGIDKGNQLPEKYNPLLKNFLVHCDLVKFAEHQPTTEDIQKTFDSCKAFIAETKMADPAEATTTHGN